MIVVTVFLSILNQMDFYLVQNRMEICHLCSKYFLSICFRRFKSNFILVFEKKKFNISFNLTFSSNLSLNKYNVSKQGCSDGGGRGMPSPLPLSPTPISYSDIVSCSVHDNNKFIKQRNMHIYLNRFTISK